ncbi:9597_t:CDS:2, partial [Dentiscutata erythropus]
VQSINTPGGSVAVGATITITWQYTQQTNPLPGTLSVVDSVTKNTTIISKTIVLSTKNYQWTVNVPPATYYLALNDGSGDKDTAGFQVFSPGGNTSSAPSTPSGSTPASGPGTTSSSGSSGSSGSSPSPTKANAAPPKIGFTGSDKLLFSFIVVAAAMMHFI